MTPQDCLTCPVADLMPVCARIMGEGWFVCGDDEIGRDWPINEPNFLDEKIQSLFITTDLDDAFRLQAEIARRGLQEVFVRRMEDIMPPGPEREGKVGTFAWWEPWFYATATAEQRCRACCAALLEHEQRKGTA